MEETHTFKTPLRLEWLCLIAVFLIAGILGHDPWKQDETYSFGIIHHFYVSHSWLIPTNAGEPFLEKPPLYYWTAVLFCKAFAGMLPLHDAARLTSFFYMLVASVFMMKMGRLLPNQHLGRAWIPLALFLGTLGLVRHAHDMFTDVALLAGDTIALYGMMLLLCAQNRWKEAGRWLGLGVGVAFMSKGLFVPVVLGLSFVALWLIRPVLRSRETRGALITALIVASPFLLIWPMLLYRAAPELFHVWFWDNNVGRFLGYSVDRLGADNKPHYFLYAVLWFAFPVFPLACLEVLRGCREWKRPEYIFPLVVSVAGMGLLLASASARALYLLPLLPVFALLAAQTLEHVPAFVLGIINKVLRIFFSVAIALVWFQWWDLRHPVHLHVWRQLAGRLDDMLSLPPDFMPAHNQHIACMVAAIGALLWVISWRLSSRAALNVAYSWFAGIAVLWISANTLLLPWIDHTKSYQPIIKNMESYLQSSPYRNDCVGAYHLGESIPPMLEYFGKSTWGQSQELSGPCPLVVIDVKKGAPTPQSMDARWALLWKGSREMDSKNMEMRLYARKP